MEALSNEVTTDRKEDTYSHVCSGKYTQTPFLKLVKIASSGEGIAVTIDNESSGEKSEEMEIIVIHFWHGNCSIQSVLQNNKGK